MKSSTRITIPIIHGVYGTIDEYPFTRQGQTRFGKVHWITPIELEYPDGWDIYKVHLEPRLLAFEGEQKLNIWDARQRSKPLFIGHVKFNCTDNSYVVELEPKYRCYRLSMVLLLQHTPQEPFYTNAFRNGTPYGEWRYKDTI